MGMPQQVCCGYDEETWEVELADKPGSVVGSHSSGTMVTHRLKQPTRRLRRAADVRRRACLFGFAPSGVYLAVRVATSAVSSYLAISTLPDPVSRPAIGGIFSVALSVALGRGLHPRLIAPRRYLALCPMEPGLSSTRQSTQRLPGQLRHAVYRSKRRNTAFVSRA